MTTKNSSPELLSLVLTLRPLEGPYLEKEPPRWWGRAAQALLLKTIQQNDPDLAASLHDKQGPNAFTASTLMGSMRNHRLDPGQTYTLRMTSLKPELSALLLNAARPGGVFAPDAQVELDFHPFKVEAASSDPAGHPWAAAAAYGDLGAAHLTPGGRPPRRISLQWTSPTVFHSKGKQVPLPLPDMVFGSLLDRWNAYAPVSFPAEVRRYARECLAVSRYNLRTRTVQFKEDAVRVGAAGRVSFTALNFDRYWMGILHTLAAFSLYSGLGAATGMGMGQCRPAEPRKNSRTAV